MLILPIGDEPNDPGRVAWMNYALIAMNIALYALALSKGTDGWPAQSGYDQFVLRWAYNPSDASVPTLFSSMFMHANWMHLGGNMLFLWIFGDNVEARLGPLLYLIAYLILGVVATLAFGLFNAGLDEPVLGASGAISGVQGLYWIACPRHRVKVFVWVFIIIVTVIHVNARWIMVFWFFMQDVLPMLVGEGPTGGGVAHLAHLGGFAGGVLLMLGMRSFLPRMQAVEEGELAHARRYRGGRAGSRRYERIRRRDPYAPGGRKLSRPPPLPPRDPDA